ncbi:MAG: hypothetical protein ACYYKD_04415 [Rhodospirillales bacterium]
MNKFALLAIAAVAVVATVVFGISSAEATFWGSLSGCNWDSPCGGF